MQKCSDENGAICVHLCSSVVNVIIQNWYQHTPLIVHPLSYHVRLITFETQRRRDTAEQRGKQSNHLCSSLSTALQSGRGIL
jgi:hypothetical protein